MAQATQKRSMKLLEAQDVANDILEKLIPLCGENRCVIAGSIRRKQEMVGDIEIVCLPKTGKAKSPGTLFAIEQNLVIHWLNTKHHERHGIKIVKGGPRYHQFMYGSYQVDLFMPPPKQWGRILAMRTGPESFSIKMASRWCEMGYRGHKGELVKLGSGNPRFKPKFPSEKSLFEFLGWDYIEPEKRQ